MRALLAILSLLGIAGAAGYATYHGAFYVTGSQFYQACWERRAKEKFVGGFKDAEANNPTQAVLWANCTPIVARGMDEAGFAFGSSASEAPADAKALAGSCPDRQTEIPLFLDRLYIVVVDIVEKNGGPSLIDRVAPAEWLVQRSVKARWPRCTEAAKPFLAKARKPDA